MRSFVKIFMSLFLLANLCGCGVNNYLTLNQNLSQTQVHLHNEQFRVLGEAIGKAEATYIIGIGGLSKKAIMNNAVVDMYRQAKLRGAQTIVNINVHSHVGGVFPFYFRVTYVATGQIVEFFGANNSSYENKEASTVKIKDKTSDNSSYENKEASTAKIEDKTSDLNYSIGDIYKESGKNVGVVVSVSEDGKHGKMIYYWDIARKWSNKNDVTGANNSYDGAYNCKVLSIYNIKDYPAAALCKNGWYLPSAKEMSLVFENLESINATLFQLGWYRIDESQKYWTSTETSATEAIAVANKAFVVTSKLEQANVIAMRTF